MPNTAHATDAAETIRDDLTRGAAACRYRAAMIEHGEDLTARSAYARTLRETAGRLDHAALHGTYEPFTPAELRTIYRGLELAEIASEAFGGTRSLGVKLLRSRVRAMLEQAGETL